MNVKSLLLGSAAAIVAVSGARAADAVVVAEPEPMEYVRVCDVYGSGFYYVPGTETCLKVSGYVRVDIRAGDGKYEKLSNSGEQTYNNRARFQLRADARTETELGTLRSYAAVNFNYQGNTTKTITGVDADDKVVTTSSYDNDDLYGWDHLYIELGGFRIGKTDSLFATFTDYAGGVMNDGEVPFSPFGTIQVAYTYTGANGLSAALALEQGDESDGGITQDYVPYVVGGLSFTQDWGKVGVVAGYDTRAEEVAIKARLDVNITETAKVFVMGAYDTDGDDTHPDDADDKKYQNYYAPWGGDWAIWGGASVKFNEKATFNTEISYDDTENFAAVANIAYNLVPGLTITPEIAYFDNFDKEDKDSLMGHIRFQRNF